MGGRLLPKRAKRRLVPCHRSDHLEQLDQRQDEEALRTAVMSLARYRIDWVRRALFYSLGLVLASGLVGVVLGYIACRCIGKSNVWVTALQVVGAALVLWATLAVRGWEIQTFASVTLPSASTSGFTDHYLAWGQPYS
jgi:hypothetical protein